MPALAIPEDEAIKKLEAVAVYVVVNAEGQPAFYQESPDQLVLPMFMTAERAQQAQQTLEEHPDAEGSRIVSVPLNVAFERNEQLIQTLKARDENKSLITPLVPAQADWEKAKEILLAEEVSPEEIDRKLQVPVFLTDPPISITPPGAEEAKIALFFNYSQLQAAKEAVPDFDGEDKVVDWRQAINWIIEDEEDKYFFLPTEDLIRTLQDQQRLQEQQQQSDPRPSPARTRQDQPGPTRPSQAQPGPAQSRPAQPEPTRTSPAQQQQAQDQEESDPVQLPGQLPPPPISPLQEQQQ